MRQIYASASGSTVREIVQDVLERAGLDDVFSSHGVELDDTITRAVYPVQSVMTILRELADLHGAIVTVDEWLEIDLVRRTNLEPLTAGAEWRSHRKRAQHRPHHRAALLRQPRRHRRAW